MKIIFFGTYPLSTMTEITFNVFNTPFANGSKKIPLSALLETGKLEFLASYVLLSVRKEGLGF